MKKDMPLEGLRWSRDSGSALCDTSQNSRSRTGWGGNIFIRSMAISLFCIVVSALPVLLENTFIGYPAKMESQMDCRNIHFYKYFCRFH